MEMAEYIERSAAIKAAKHAWAKGLEPSQYIEALPGRRRGPGGEWAVGASWRGRVVLLCVRLCHHH